MYLFLLEPGKYHPLYFHMMMISTTATAHLDENYHHNRSSPQSPHWHIKAMIILPLFYGKVSLFLPCIFGTWWTSYSAEWDGIFTQLWVYFTAVIPHPPLYTFVSFKCSLFFVTGLTWVGLAWLTRWVNFSQSKINWNFNTFRINHCRVSQARELLKEDNQSNKTVIIIITIKNNNNCKHKTSKIASQT